MHRAVSAVTIHNVKPADVPILENEPWLTEQTTGHAKTRLFSVSE